MPFLKNVHMVVVKVLARRLEVVAARVLKLNKHIFLMADLVLITQFQDRRPLIGLKKQGRWCRCQI